MTVIDIVILVLLLISFGVNAYYISKCMDKINGLKRVVDIKIDKISDRCYRNNRLIYQLDDELIIMRKAIAYDIPHFYEKIELAENMRKIENADIRLGIASLDELEANSLKRINSSEVSKSDKE